MKASLCASLVSMAFIAVFSSRAPAEPIDAGIQADAARDAAAAADATVPAEPGADAAPTDNGVPFACNRALCDTTTGDTACGVAPGFHAERGVSPISASFGLVALALGTLARRARREKDRVR